MDVKQIEKISKYFLFYILYVLNVLNLYFFLLRSWRVKDVLNYTDENYKGYLDMTEMYGGYVSGWSILFILSLIYSIVYIKKHVFYAFLWLCVPIFYLLILAGHEYL